MLVTGVIIDGGLLFFEERGARNAADAASLAGAKQLYELRDTTNYSGLALDQNCDTPGLRWAGSSYIVGPFFQAFDAACDIAESHGYFDSDPDTEVRVRIPPIAPADPDHHSPKNVQVLVRQTRSSISRSSRRYPPGP
jgi:Flp pilus assembly protein TadG